MQQPDIYVFISIALVATFAAIARADVPQSTHIIEVKTGGLSLKEAAATAQSGDTFEISPGTYRECAIWKANGISIVGIGSVTITGDACSDKALFVIQGEDVTVRNITFTGARVPDHNGAGIRAEGGNLTVDHSRFIDNEDGILGEATPQSTIVIRDSYFAKNGTCTEDCAHGIYINRIALLRVEHCEFFDQKVGHHVKSRAMETDVIGNFIHDGPEGTASYLVDIPIGGNVLIKDNRFEKGPNSQNPSTAIAIGAERNRPQNPTERIEITDNSFMNDLPQPTFFVHNWTTTVARLRGNKLTGSVNPIEGPGVVETAPGHATPDRGG